MLPGKLKNTFIVLLTFIFVYNTFGFLIIHPLLQSYFKNLGIVEASSPDKQSLIEKIVINKDDISLGIINYERIDPKEFRLNGKMYDIVNEEETESVLVLYCINDELEDEYEKDFDKKFDDNLANKKQKSGDNNPFKILTSEAANFPEDFQSDVNKLTYGDYTILNYVSDWKEILSPPPQFIS